MNARLSPDDWSSDLSLITMAANAAGEKALSYFRKDPDVQWKNGGRSPVSEADFAANDILKEKLLAARPNYGWLSEETDDDAARLGCDTVFVVDPIDGTRAFIAGKDVWCVSVAVVHLGRPVAGVLFAPALGELFQAVSTGDALKNGEPISVRPTGADSPADRACRGDGRLAGKGVSRQRVAHSACAVARLPDCDDRRWPDRWHDRQEKLP